MEYHPISGSIPEFLAFLRTMPEWQKAEWVVRNGVAVGRSFEAIADDLAPLLAEMGLTPEVVLEDIPPELLQMVPAELAHKMERAAGVALTLLVIAGLTDDPQAAMVPFTKHAMVIQSPGGPVVMGLASVVDPELAIADFANLCYRTFPAEAFARSSTRARDAEWTGRWLRGESYRAIALTDPRSGVDPEVIADPDYYPDEVRRATERVRKAIQRYRKGWTKKARFVSRDSA